MALYYIRIIQYLYILYMHVYMHTKDVYVWYIVCIELHMYRYTSVYHDVSNNISSSAGIARRQATQTHLL